MFTTTASVDGTPVLILVTGSSLVGFALGIGAAFAFGRGDRATGEIPPEAS